MNKDFYKIFFTEPDSIDNRFREENYTMTEDEVSTVHNYIDNVFDNGKKSGNLSFDDFKTFIKVIEVLDRSPYNDSRNLLAYAFIKAMKR